MVDDPCYPSEALAFRIVDARHWGFNEIVEAWGASPLLGLRGAPGALRARSPCGCHKSTSLSRFVALTPAARDFLRCLAAIA